MALNYLLNCITYNSTHGSCYFEYSQWSWGYQQKSLWLASITDALMCYSMFKNFAESGSRDSVRGRIPAGFGWWLTPRCSCASAGAQQVSHTGWPLRGYVQCILHFSMFTTTITTTILTTSITTATTTTTADAAAVVLGLWKGLLCLVRLGCST